MYSKQEAVEAVREVAKYTQGPLSKRDYKKLRGPEHPAPYVFYRRFGGWNAIKEEARLETESSGGKLNADYDFFENPVYDEQIYWLGFLMGDGSVWNNSSGNSTLSLSIQEKHHVKKFKQALNAEHKISENDGLYYLRICDEKLTSDLEKWGIHGDKTFSTDLPDFWEAGDTSPRWNPFVRGLFDADGSIYFDETRVVWYISGYGSRLERLRKVIPVNLTLYDGGSRNDQTKRLKTNKISDVVTLREWMYPDHDHTRLERKYNKMCEVDYGSR